MRQNCYTNPVASCCTRPIPLASWMQCISSPPLLSGCYKIQRSRPSRFLTALHLVTWGLCRVSNCHPHSLTYLLLFSYTSISDRTCHSFWWWSGGTHWLGRRNGLSSVSRMRCVPFASPQSGVCLEKSSLYFSSSSTSLSFTDWSAWHWTISMSVSPTCRSRCLRSVGWSLSYFFSCLALSVWLVPWKTCQSPQSQTGKHIR